MKRPKLVIDINKISTDAAPIDYSVPKKITIDDIKKFDRNITSPVIFLSTNASVYKNQTQKHIVSLYNIHKVYINDKQSKVVVICRPNSECISGIPHYYYTDRILEISKADHLCRSLHIAGKTLSDAVKVYQNSLLQMNTIFVLNFFVSVIPVAFLINWVYYKSNRSILAAFLLHLALNFSAVLFQTTQFTKCLFTLVLMVVALIVYSKDKDFFTQKS